MTLILPQPPGRPKPPATVLQGPADADAFRVKVGRYKDRYYCDPLPSCPIAEATDEHWPSVSRIKGAKPFEGANYVAMKRIAQEFAKGTAFATTYDACYEQLKSVDRLGLKAAGDRGTHVHKMAEQMLYGLPVTEQGPGAEYLGALRQFFDVHQPVLHSAEVVCINRTVGYGGTGDAAVWINGKLYLIDWKSRDAKSDHAAYPEEGGQLGAYADAEYWIVADGEGGAKRIPVPELDGLLILSVRPDGVRVYPIDMDGAKRYWRGLHAWWTVRQAEDEHAGKPWAVQNTKPARTDLPPGVVAASAPPKPKPDEGEPADPVAVEALQRAFMKLGDEAKLLMKRVAAEALAADRPISVAQNPSVRRFEIARMLIAWVSYSEWPDSDSWDGFPDDQKDQEALLRAVLAMVIGTDAAEMPGVPLGAVVSLLDPATARRCTEIFDALAAGAGLGVDDAGRTVLLAA